MKVSQYRKVLPYLLVVLATILVYIGVRAVQSNQTNKLFTPDELERGLLKEAERFEGETYLVPPKELYPTGLTAEQLAALNNPEVTTIADADSYLADELFGISVEVNGQYRFYPYQIINWHEIVNDSLGGKDIVVTHCVLCRTSRAFERTVDGSLRTFEPAHIVYNNQSIMRDAETGSLWLQPEGIGIRGTDISYELTTVDSTVVPWVIFKTEHPDGTVLSNNTGFDFDYTRHPYTNYDTAETIFFPTNTTDNRVGNPKWLVTGVETGGSRDISFVYKIEKGYGAVNVVIDDSAYVGFYDYSYDFVRVYNPTVNGQTLTFDYDFTEKRYYDNETNSTWNASGEAVSGALRGESLTVVPSVESFWFSWSVNHPNSYVGTLTEQNEHGSSEE